MSFAVFQKHFPALAPAVADRLQRYAALLAEWQPKINLVGPKTMPELWARHFLDSAQLFPLLPADTVRLVDMGSGAGFPGVVLAIMGVPEVHLLESDQRKGIFMQHVSRETKTPVTVHTARIEAVPALAADVVTARALAPLAELLPYTGRHLKPDGAALFLKGAGWQQEIEEARAAWEFHVKHHPSLTAPDAAILEITGLRPRA